MTFPRLIPRLLLGPRCRRASRGLSSVFFKDVRGCRAPLSAMLQARKKMPACMPSKVGVPNRWKEKTSLKSGKWEFPEDLSKMLIEILNAQEIEHWRSFGVWLRSRFAEASLDVSAW